MTGKQEVAGEQQPDLPKGIKGMQTLLHALWTQETWPQDAWTPCLWISHLTHGHSQHVL